MRVTLAIVKRELGQYFLTWTAYIIVALVLFVQGLIFNANALGGEQQFSEKVLGTFFYDYSGIIMVAGILLSMRLLAEEKQMGTDVLLFTSPLTERRIVYAKFFAASAFLLFLLFVSLYMPALVFMYGKISLGHIFTGYFGLFLLGSSVLSIGLFASCVSPNQWIALLLGVVLVVVLVVLWMMSKVASAPLDEIFGYVAIHNLHFRGFKQGFIHSRDVIYYLSLTLLFLEGSVKVLQAKRWYG